MMSIKSFINSPFPWVVLGLAIGLAFGVTTVSVCLLVVALLGFVGHLKFHGSAKPSTEGKLFAAGPALLLAWIAGFVCHSLIL